MASSFGPYNMKERSYPLQTIIHFPSEESETRLPVESDGTRHSIEENGSLETIPFISDHERLKKILGFSPGKNMVEIDRDSTAAAQFYYSVPYEDSNSSSRFYVNVIALSFVIDGMPENKKLVVQRDFADSSRLRFIVIGKNHRTIKTISKDLEIALEAIYWPHVNKIDVLFVPLLLFERNANNAAVFDLLSETMIFCNQTERLFTLKTFLNYEVPA